MFGQTSIGNTVVPSSAKVSFLESLLICRRVSHGVVSVVYEFDGTAEALAKLVQELELRKDELGVLEWGISKVTLDDVFLKLCGDTGHEG